MTLFSETSLLLIGDFHDPYCADDIFDDLCIHRSVLNKCFNLKTGFD